MIRWVVRTVWPSRHRHPPRALLPVPNGSRVGPWWRTDKTCTKHGMMQMVKLHMCRTGRLRQKVGAEPMASDFWVVEAYWEFEEGSHWLGFSPKVSVLLEAAYQNWLQNPSEPRDRKNSTAMSVGEFAWKTGWMFVFFFRSANPGKTKYDCSYYWLCEWHRRGSVHRRTGNEFGINSPCSTWPSFQEFLHNTMDPRDLNRSQAFDFRTFTCRWRVVTHLCKFQHGLSLFFWFTSYVHRCLLVLRPYESSDFQSKRQHPSFLMGILHLWPILESFCFHSSMVCVESFTLQEVRSQIHGKDFLPRT